VNRRARLAVIGIGNTLAGDDGVGIVIADRLRRRWPGSAEVLVATLPGDLFAVSDLLDRASEFLFLDAIAGDDPGEIRTVTAARRAFSASLHQTDIGAVMAALARLEVVEPFPDWQIWGITIDRPDELGEGLSPPVSAAAEKLEARIVAYVEDMLRR
jgi:hydrogenase maturation protease